VEVALRAACQQSHYANVMYATEESQVREAWLSLYTAVNWDEGGSGHRFPLD
jgi:hypothetical protein